MFQILEKLAIKLIELLLSNMKAKTTFKNILVKIIDVIDNIREHRHCETCGAVIGENEKYCEKCKAEATRIAESIFKAK